MALVDFGNLGDLSKPATALVKRIAEGVGGLARPWQITRVARADAEAKKIAAAADIEVNEMQQRAIVRMIHEEEARQRNIEQIVGDALPQLMPAARPDDVAADWLAYFLEQCRLVSDEQMQSIWSRILSGEVNAPGSFWKRTVDTVAKLEKSEATMFTELCGFCWKLENGDLQPFLYHHSDLPHAGRGLTFAALQHLSTIGLVTFSTTQWFTRENLPTESILSYFGKPVELEFRGDERHIDVGHVLFTTVVDQLAPIAGGEPSNDIFNDVVSRWREMNIIRGEWSAERL